MEKRIWSAPGLVCALFLLLITASTSLASEDRTSEIQNFEAKWRLGARINPVPNPQPNDGVADPGDDDMPNREGQGSFGNASHGDRIAVGPRTGFWRLRAYMAGIRLQVLKILRAWN